MKAKSRRNQVSTKCIPRFSVINTFVFRAAPRATNAVETAYFDPLQVQLHSATTPYRGPFLLHGKSRKG